MKLLRKYLFFACSILMMFAACSSSDPDETIPGSDGGGNSGGSEPAPEVETIEYRAQVWVDKADLQRYGGERVFKNNLKKLFRNTTRFWNESPNKFKYYFSFVPGDDLHIYDIQGNKANYDKFKNEAFGDLDITKYDFVVFFALDVEKGKGGLSCGGGGASGQSVVMAYLDRNTNIFTDAEYPNQGTYSNLGHEYGHVRGAQDLYQYKISAESNRISHEAFVPPACNMGTGYRVWSDFCSALFNYDARQKQLDKNLGTKIFPANLQVRVTKAGAPRKGVKVNFYGTRAGGYFGGPDVYDAEGNSPYLKKSTDENGEFTISNVYKMYHPDQGTPNIPPKSPKDEFPYSRWYCFLVEVIDGSTKKYVWLSDLDMCEEHLRTGNDTYKLEVAL